MLRTDRSVTYFVRAVVLPSYEELQDVGHEPGSQNHAWKAPKTFPIVSGWGVRLSPLHSGCQSAKWQNERCVLADGCSRKRGSLNSQFVRQRCEL